MLASWHVRASYAFQASACTQLSYVDWCAAAWLDVSVAAGLCSFEPGPRPVSAGSFTADTKTAGSCTLMVQQSLPVLLFAAPDAAPR